MKEAKGSNQVSVKNDLSWIFYVIKKLEYDYQFKDKKVLDLSKKFIEHITKLPIMHEVKLKRIRRFREMIEVISERSMQDINAQLVKELLIKTKKQTTLQVIKGLISFIADNYNESFTEDLQALNHAIGAKSGIKDIITYIENIESISSYYRCNLSASNYNKTLYADSDVKEIKEVFIKTLRKENQDLCIPFVNNFSKSLTNVEVKSIYDLTFETMVMQAKYISKKFGQKYCGYIKDFYIYVQQNYIPDIFDIANIPINVVYRTRFMKELVNDFVPIHYNPFEDTPIEDKWLLIFNNDNETNSIIRTCSSIEFDFTLISNEIYRRRVKSFIWNTNVSIASKERYYGDLKHFFDYIDKIENNKVISLSCRNTVKNIINEGKVIAYKDYVREQYGQNNTSLNKLHSAKRLLEYLQATESDILVGNSLFFLNNLFSAEKNSAKALEDDELVALAAAVNDNQDTLAETLSSIVFYLSITTEFRTSQILSLKTDCIKEVGKKGQFVIVSKTKITGTQEIEQPITIETKRSIENAIKITSGYRKKCMEKVLKDYIFLLPDSKYIEERGVYKLLTSQSVNNFLAKCCNIAKIDNKYNLTNMRDTHITLAKEHVLRNNLSDLDQMVLSGHNNVRTDSAHYIDKDREFTKVLEATNHIIIGNISIKGHIIEDSRMNDSNIVEQGCGYCFSEECINTLLGCLMCESFITMPNRISYFEEQIKIIDEQINTRNIIHDKEDLINIKRLLVAYIKELYMLKEGDKNKE